MRGLFLRCVFLWATLQRSNSQTAAVPASVLSRCEGDILLLQDSSGSVANHDFSCFLRFVSNLLRPFSLGRGHVRVALLQVGTSPQLEFNLDDHNNQESLQEALQRVSQLQGDTNNVAALEVAQQILTKTEGNGPKVLLWLTDGVQPGDVDKPMLELKAQGVSVLIICTIHGDYQVLKRVVTPPLDSHLYSVDIDSIDIIAEDLRTAIIKIICAEQLNVIHLTSHSAVLQWSPVLTADSGYYELLYKSVRTTSPGFRKTLSGDSSRAELTDLQPETTYTASLRPESNQRLFSTFSVDFTTLPGVLSPAEVSLSESGPHQIRVSWGPLQLDRVQRYTLEYGAIPSGRVQIMTLTNQAASALLTGLEPGTQYLVTVNALHVDGKERAMSVRACTQEVLPALVDLQLAPIEGQLVQEVQAAWRAHTEGLKGFWVSWEKQNYQNPLSDRSVATIYLPPTTPSAQLTHVTPNSRVCVSPVYRSGRGDGICCTANTHSGLLN
ncbi:von Willebrand factor A domain-containing protein 1-like [Odontesthes bonariensis]|uniref:von Willebrand factor A domain-containing protein 1-like n=1 Tax=Odontesthes bonariensis TaxID=219752 RepID=UPI003F586964